jgi:hypothetical protein
MEAGRHAAAPGFPDYYENLRGLQEYSERFANKNAGNENRGCNYLFSFTVIKKNLSGLERF